MLQAIEIEAQPQQGLAQFAVFPQTRLRFTKGPSSYRIKHKMPRSCGCVNGCLLKGVR